MTVAQLIQEKIRLLGWEILPRPTYAPDLAVTDFHFFLLIIIWTFYKRQNIHKLKRNVVKRKVGRVSIPASSVLRV